MIDPAHVEWARDLFEQLKDKEFWLIPRNGMKFRREEDTLVLVECMDRLLMCLPDGKSFDVTPKRLKRQQQYEFDRIKEIFNAAGISVQRKI